MPKRKTSNLSGKKNSNRMKRNRNNETEEQQQNRLSQMREYATNSRGIETEEQRQGRLSQMREYENHSRDVESEEQRQQRLNTMRLRIGMARAQQFHCQIQERLLEIRQNSQTNEYLTSICLQTKQHFCGNLDELCTFCGAKYFALEKPVSGIYNKCCSQGKVKLTPINTSPFICNLMSNNHIHSLNFMNCIRNINNSLAFASMGAKISPPPGHGPYCFRVNGAVYHRAGALHPPSGNERKFAQLYILDSDEACEKRLQITENKNIEANLLKELSDFMHQVNPFAEACKMMYEVEQECSENMSINGGSEYKVTMEIMQNRNRSQHPGRYNIQKTNEVAIIFLNENGEPPLDRDLLIHCKANPDDPHTTRLERISILDPNLEPLIYPLLFPFGDQSWGIDIPLHEQPRSIINITSNQPQTRRSRVTQMQYYSYRLATRDIFNPFLSAGKLTQQYIVDAYVKLEANRLNYIKQNQKKLRVEKYRQLMDDIEKMATTENVLPGTAVVLPSTFAGSPRNMLQNYQDAMAIVRKYGKPDLFITMTCNPKWREITENLNGQSVENRPDLVSRVFNIKLKSLLHDICKKHIFGKIVAFVYVIEFQKRGLPHAHMLLILKDEFKPKSIEIIDQIVNAEIPDINLHSNLHSLVIKHMIHGPCEGNPQSLCMKNNKCSKEFPKKFQNETDANFNGYPKYKRRNNGVTATVNGKEIDNSYVVPYNPMLLLKYQCHINVEICASIKSVKYLFKYIYKGHDCATIAIKERNVINHDEVQSFLDTRYVSAPEAMWRINGYHMHEQSHVITRLPVHLPEEQNVYFQMDDINQIVERESEKYSMLTAWFKLNQDPSSESRQLHYSEIPQHFRFVGKIRKWIPRVRGISENTIGRMYMVNLSSDPERYCMRLLLLHSPGINSFEDLRTVNNITYTSFKDAAKAKGLIHDENTWEKTLEEATVCNMPMQLRELFAYICIFAVPTNALQLFEKFEHYLMEDFIRIHKDHNDDCTMCKNETLIYINKILMDHGKNCSMYSLPIPNNNIPFNFNTEDTVNIQFYIEQADQMENNLNIEQKIVLNEILSACSNEGLPHRCFFLDGPGGSGKTYLYKLLICKFKAEGQTVLPVASTGIAANLLEGGRTYHSQFKLPVPLLETSTSSMRMSSQEAETIRSSKLIIWDEATMAPGIALSAINKLLQDIMKNHKPFGGKVMLLGGDFRQTLPIVPHGTRTNIVETSIKFSPLWKIFKILKLNNNVRSDDPEFTSFLMTLGNGSHEKIPSLNDDELIEIPPNIMSNGDIIEEIFGNTLNSSNVKEYSKRAILCTKNMQVDAVNEEILQTIPGNSTTFLSIDSIDDANEEDAQNYPIEFLNNLTTSGMPRHKLNVKIGAVIMLLRNLNTKKGLCNGTRLLVKDIKPNLIIAEILLSNFDKSRVFIPRIDLAPSNSELPFTLRRRQFPVKLAFAMTINKAQGQTLDKVGVYLPEPVFSHGQLYVAMSRVRRFNDIVMKIEQGSEQGTVVDETFSLSYTKNIVFMEIFDL